MFVVNNLSHLRTKLQNRLDYIIWSRFILLLLNKCPLIHPITDYFCCLLNLVLLWSLLYIINTLNWLLLYKRISHNFHNFLNFFNFLNLLIYLNFLNLLNLLNNFNCLLYCNSLNLRIFDLFNRLFYFFNEINLHSILKIKVLCILSLKTLNLLCYRLKDWQVGLSVFFVKLFDF